MIVTVGLATDCAGEPWRPLQDVPVNKATNATHRESRPTAKRAGRSFRILPEFVPSILRTSQNNNAASVSPGMCNIDQFLLIFEFRVRVAN